MTAEAMTTKEWFHRWPNFPRTELQCPCCKRVPVDPEFLDLLQSMRAQRGAPMVISSCYRCEEHNRDIGSVTKNHVLGISADIVYSGARERFELIESAIAHAFRRIGVYTHHIHIDRNTAAPQDVFWMGA